MTVSVRPPPKKKAGSKGADSYYEYDARGNRKANFEQMDFLSEETAEFDYNEEDKLYYAEVGENETFISYSSNGYRSVKQENSDVPVFYIYDSSGRLHAKAYPAYFTTNSGTQIIMYPINQYIWGPDRVLAQIDADDGKTYYYLYNGHGDVVQIIDTDGNIKNTYDYDVWGNFITKSETIDNPFTYFGQTYDETTGLYYLRARYYDPTTGRFTQQDPAEDGYNWYVYGNQNPVMFVDPYGMKAKGELITIGTGSYSDVYAIQMRLVILGFTDESGNALVQDGIYGAHTQAAIRKFQSQKGLEVDGIVGDKTWIALGFDYDSDFSYFEVVKKVSPLPPTGPPNSKKKLYDEDGELKQEREYGPDGKAKRDIDYKHGGVGHEFPHEHEWDWGKNPPRQATPTTNTDISNIAIYGIAAFMLLGIACIA